MKLKIQKVDPSDKLPSYSYIHDAGFDLYSAEDFVIKAGERATVPTGIKMAIPEGYVGLVWDKSSLAFKGGIKSMGGVIDAGYRGEVKICLANLSREDYHINKGDKIAQMIIQKFERMEIEEADDLGETDRGAGGFGSSGKQ